MIEFTIIVKTTPHFKLTPYEIPRAIKQKQITSSNALLTGCLNLTIDNAPTNGWSIYDNSFKKNNGVPFGRKPSKL